MSIVNIFKRKPVVKKDVIVENTEPVVTVESRAVSVFLDTVNTLLDINPLNDKIVRTKSLNNYVCLSFVVDTALGKRKIAVTSDVLEYYEPISEDEKLLGQKYSKRLFVIKCSNSKLHLAIDKELSVKEVYLAVLEIRQLINTCFYRTEKELVDSYNSELTKLFGECDV